MLHRVLSDAGSVCTGIGAFTLYVVVVGGIASLVIRAAKRRRPRISTSAPAGPAIERRATGWNDRSGWPARDKNWAVVTVLLGAVAIADRTQRFVDFSSRRVDWPRLMSEADQWSRPDRLLVHVAYDLVAQDGGSSGSTGDPLEGVPPVTVIDLVTDVDQPRTDLIRAAVDLRRGACTYEQARKVSAAAA